MDRVRKLAEMDISKDKNLKEFKEQVKWLSQKEIDELLYLLKKGEL